MATRNTNPMTFLLLIALLVGALTPASPAQADEAAVPLLEWEWRGAPYTLTTVIGDDGRAYTRVSIAGYLDGDEPGKPRLPFLGRLVTLPPAGDYRLEIVAADYDTLRLAHPVEPAPAPAPATFTADGRPQPAGWEFAYDRETYGSAAPYPADFATLSPPAWQRDRRLARLTLHPFRYHPLTNTLDVLRYLKLRLVPTGDRADTAARPLAPAAIPAAPGDYKILVEQEGIYAISYDVLAAVGLPVGSIDPATLRLYHAGHEVAARWDGDSDAAFESGERLLFYARPALTRYARYDVYWLSWGGAPGLRMATRSGDPASLTAGVPWATAQAEENYSYDSLHPGRDGGHWFWQLLRQPDVLTATFPIHLETPTSDAGQITVWLQGTTRAWPDPDHHVRFTINGHLLGDGWWEGKTPYTATFSIPAGALQAGDNTLLLELPGDTGDPIEGMWMDAAALTYGLSAVSGGTARFRGEDTPHAYTVAGFDGLTPAVYDVTDPAAPRIVTGWTSDGGRITVGDGDTVPAEYLITADVRQPAGIIAAKDLSDPAGGGADYVIITHPQFATAIAPLADHRAAQGLQVVTVDVEAIYDHFGDGRMSPEAIHDFLKYAYANWTPAPLYVLLVGDGTYDPRPYRADSHLTYLPPYLADVDPWMGETSSDNRYADLTGDRLPELRLGRLPVNSPAETTAIVDKIIAYDDASGGLWTRRLLFAADNPSTAGDHRADADQQYLTYASPTSTYGYEGVRVYLSETAGPSYYYTSAEAARNALISALDSGVLLYTYFGHSSWLQEAVLETDGYAPLFHVSHIPQLNNSGRWPMVLQMTCFTSYYIHPTEDTLDESLLRVADNGVIATWGSSGNGVTPDHRLLNGAFLSSLFGGPVWGDEQPEVGANVQAALTALYAEGASYELIDTYHLLGDPALELRVSPSGNLPHILYLPLIARHS